MYSDAVITLHSILSNARAGWARLQRARGGASGAGGPRAESLASELPSAVTLRGAVWFRTIDTDISGF